MQNNKKPTKKLFSLMSNLQTYYHFKFISEKWTNIQGASG